MRNFFVMASKKKKKIRDKKPKKQAVRSGKENLFT